MVKNKELLGDTGSMEAATTPPSLDHACTTGQDLRVKNKHNL